MQKIMMIGKVGCGKTTLSQRLTGQALHDRKTQTIQVVGDNIVDTPGEYFEQKQFCKALIITAIEADVILLLHSADEEQHSFSPGMSTLFGGKPMIGVITKTDICPQADSLATAREMLEMAGAFAVVATGLGDEKSLEELRCLIETLGRTE